MKRLFHWLESIPLAALRAIPCYLLFCVLWYAGLCRQYAYEPLVKWFKSNKTALLIRTILAERALAKAIRRIDSVEEFICNNFPYPHGFGYIRIARLNGTLCWIKQAFSSLRIGLKGNLPLQFIFARFLCNLPEMSPDLEDRIKATGNSDRQCESGDYDFHTQVPEVELLIRCLELKNISSIQREEFLFLAREILCQHVGVIFDDAEPDVNSQNKGDE